MTVTEAFPETSSVVASRGPGPKPALMGAASAAAISLLLTSTGWGALAVVLVVLGTVVVFPGSIGTRLLLGSVALSAAASTWVLAMSALGLGLQAPLLCCLLAGSLGAVLTGGRWAPPPPLDISAAVTTLAGAALLWRVARPSTSQMMDALVVGEDNASHLSIMMGIRGAGGYLYGASGPQVDRVNAGLQDYPQAVHATAAVVSKLVQPASLGAVDVVAHYWLAMSIVYLLFVLGISEAGLGLARRLGVQGRAVVVAALLPVLVAVLGPFFSLLVNGFFTQLATYAALSAMLVLALLPSDLVPWWVRAGLMTTGVLTIAGSWYIVLPVAGTCFAASLWFDRASVRPGAARAISPLIVLAICLSGAPHVLASLRSGAASYVNAQGGVVSIGVTVAAICILIPILAHPPRVDALTVSKTWWLSWCAALSFSIALMAYQLVTAGAVSYYFEKSLYTVVALSTVGAAGFLAEALGRPRRSDSAVGEAGGGGGVRVATAVLLSVVLLLPLVLHPGGSLAHAFAARREPVRWDSILTPMPDRTEAPIVFWRHHGRLRDYQANRLLGAVYGQDSPQRWNAVMEGRTGSQGALLGLLREDEVTLITSDINAAGTLRDSGASRGLVGRARVIVLVDEGEEPST